MDEINELSKEILDHALKELSLEFSYLVYPLGLLDFCVGDIDGLAYTNGKIACLNTKEIVMATAEKGIKEVGVTVLHLLLHCIFLHPFKQVENRFIYDLAVDISVGYVLDGLGYSHGERRDKEVRKSTYKAIIDLFGNINDRFCIDYCKGLKKENVEQLYSAFKVCNHDNWLGRKDGGEANSPNSDVNISFGDMQEGVDDESLNDVWGAVAKTLIPRIGKLNPNLKRMISVTVGEVGNYKSFLKSFLRRRERIKPSDEEFDYIYYYLGLKNYGNVPLIENLEYSDRREFSDIAVAVDTSGSTDGEPIKKLLQEVFSLVKSMETESKKYRLRIIQCDLKIQREDLITSADDFAKTLKNYKLEGGGGTDFCPVFEYLTSLKKKGEKIEGLIYFTDGVGVYPREVPPFKTCFAILGDNEGVNVPHFAYRINIEE
ncbi:MAG: hypothetical protein IKA99_07350 [Clostridia bacterium]|nr:hypothetical protein [Clostridia bacterium]